MLFDAHTHIFDPAQRETREALAARDAPFAEMYGDPKAKMATFEDLLRAMDSAGIDRAVAAGFAFANAGHAARQNAYILDAAVRSGGRVVPFATLNLADGGWRRAAESVLAGGARGFGELRPHNQGWDPLGPAAHELCELAAAHGAVLLWHVSEPVGHAYPGKRGGIGPVELCALAEAHPGTKMIAAHLGGGLPFFVQMPEIRDALRNVWFDTAAASLLYDELSVTRLVGLAGAERVLFGSDFPLLSPARQVHCLTALLESDVAEAVCGGNADTLFADKRSS
ncbi:MAG: amidohydrolase family protein [Hyphomicrobiales bacterium]